MINTEFSNQFDVLYNSITSNQAPGLNEYEKSVFLTKAQDEKLKNYFLPQSNEKQAGFDDNQKRQMDFSMLITHDDVDFTNTRGSVDPRAYVVTLQDDILYIINESVQFFDSDDSDKCLGIRQVIPLKYDEYLRLMSKPFKEPLKYQAWRLIQNGNSSPTAEIIITSADIAAYGNEIMKYICRYVKRPMPIILTDLSTAFGEDLSIGGYKGNENIYNNGRCCELPEPLHEEILQRAVELAKIAWTGDAGSVIQAGQRSE